MSLIMLALGVSTSIASAQKIKSTEVPASVTTAFKKQYANVTDVKWKKETDNFEASFDLTKIDHSVLYNAQGKVLEVEEEIELKQLPAGVADYVKSKYKNESIEEASKVIDSNGVVTYEAEVKDKDLLFDSDGKFIKESKE
jgi:hypothetical protein